MNKKKTTNAQIKKAAKRFWIVFFGIKIIIAILFIIFVIMFIKVLK